MTLTNNGGSVTWQAFLLLITQESVESLEVYMLVKTSTELRVALNDLVDLVLDRCTANE